jgi:hypothetical protein
MQGMLIGAGSGVAIGYLGGEDNASDALASRGAGAIVWGGFGIPIGAATGAIKGSNKVYLFEYNDAKDDVPTSIDSPAKRFVDSNKKTYQSNRQRRKWYLGFEYGYGFGDLSIHNNSMLPDNSTNSNSVVGVNYEIGWTVKPNILLGVRAGGFGYKKYDDDLIADYSVGRIGIVTTYFPTIKGFFTRTGVGYSEYGYQAEKDSYSDEPNEILFDDTIKGIGANIGIGYAFWLGRRFNLTLNSELKTHFFTDKKPLFWTQFLIGLMWY